MKNDKSAEQTAKTTAKKEVQVKCRVLKQIEIGNSVIAASHPDSILMDKSKAELLEKRGMVEIVGV